MSYSNSSKDTVLQLSVGKSNSSQKKHTNLKRYIIRWLKGLKALTIQKKIIYFLIIMICCFILYPTYHNRVLHNKNKGNEDLDLEEPSEIKHSYDQFQVLKHNDYIDKIRKIKQKFV
ncbi:uncharacterized protein LOC100572304 [Acyrthosiphon pisum]|uniref:Uncharacterized protein n=1 Tax=Acyrthosiphon pisum TaxID=7029 RepID=A0A8R1W880_ACYPI|nr:uncharacterized protein LOC100572304 [Acyrthosiphon pisum]|eukprot:XP_003244539.1 PREDICTED: uncharacterized protein LOC100572304 [Acyrthosiphon pisum]